ncbi:geranylgeranyl transferase type-2 subunit alpha-like isoform X3 [Dreissena polymorpha]|uniref:geranylgeranyl transferase type-2 subunit alpha-like isoform X3 n=1 Tax=Dreissena polymorpha TaxID=45954 RepID=UPI002264C361|nr:geranylgeranyl transferase type-2 subunit alpha-like isoform X3 [Dreissena polymorpha]
MRLNKEYDDEVLQLTGQILQLNSDFSTLWNYRKEVFLYYKETKSEVEMCDIYTQELQFLETCLRGNPKSYGVWNHRYFIMETMATPDWKTELQLCNLFLEYDERNFHCWDYRRFVVKHSGVSIDDELRYTTSKIDTNFSNFSSWHYRSKLLPLIYPDDETAVGVQEDVLIKEYETVQNAFFTDPDDQSAWFYHRWLLGRAKTKPSVSCMFVSRDQGHLMIVTTQAVKISPSSCEVKVVVNGEEKAGKWRTHRNQENVYSKLWIFKSADGSSWLPATQEVDVLVSADSDDWGSSDIVQLSADQSESWTLTQADQGSRFSDELSSATSDTLQRELQSIQDLYQLEPDNKWVLLTIVSLMKALDPRQYWEKIEGYLAKLTSIDPLRINYYQDLRSRYVVENYFEGFDFSGRVISLPNHSLTCVYHPELFSMVVKVDLSHNKLTSLAGFSHFQCARELTLDDNQIANLEELSFLKDLSLLSVMNNAIATQTALTPLARCPRLIKLHVEGNPVCELVQYSDIKHTVPSLHNVNGHIFG